MAVPDPNTTGNPIPFKAETRQLLKILIHSLYSEREVFLRELVSNASDALTRLSFEMLTNHNVLDPQAELAIWITFDADQHRLTIRDSGLGMTEQEVIDNLGTIAHSGARAFLEAAEQGNTHLSDIIGQFGVGFYSAFMVADWIQVVSRSYQPDAAPVMWTSTGSETYTLEPALKVDRGTEITLKLKEDALEYLQEYRLKEIVKKYSDYIPYPIYLGAENNQVNEVTALWRQSPREVKDEQLNDFYRQFSLDVDPPLTHLHLQIDAPVQLYALLFVPASPERNILSMRKQDGLKLYARKVLIQEYCPDLLPEYLRFVQGVVDSEDLPLNVSRETIHSDRVMGQLKQLLTAKVIDSLKSLAKETPETYIKFWLTYGRAIKEGIASDGERYQSLLPLLRFHTLTDPQGWSSLDDVIQRFKPEQKKIYYLLGEDDRAIVQSPHLEAYRHQGYEVLLMSDPMDSFVLLRSNLYEGHQLVNVAAEKLEGMPPAAESAGQPQTTPAETSAPAVQNVLIQRFKAILGERIFNVRLTDQLVESPARLIDQEGTLNPELQRVYRLLNKPVEEPKKILEINPHHVLLQSLAALPESDERTTLIVEQVYEDALLIEGLHPNPAAMIARIQKLMELSLAANKKE